MIMKQRINLGGPLVDLATDFEKAFENVFGELTQTDSDWVPRANVLETDSGYNIELELPGVDGGEVSVELSEGTLEITGTKTVSTEIEGTRVLKSERRHGSFRRTFKFNTPLNSENISAEFKNGILTVSLPKSEQVLPRKIDIKVSE